MRASKMVDSQEEFIRKRVGLVRVLAGVLLILCSSLAIGMAFFPAILAQPIVQGQFWNVGFVIVAINGLGSVIVSTIYIMWMNRNSPENDEENSSVS